MAPTTMAESAMLNEGQVALHVPLDEVDHVAVHLAVDHVADGAADDERIRHRGLPVAARGAAQPPRHQAADGDRQCGEEVLLPATASLRN